MDCLISVQLLKKLSHMGGVLGSSIYMECDGRNVTQLVTDLIAQKLSNDVLLMFYLFPHTWLLFLRENT